MLHELATPSSLYRCMSIINNIFMKKNVVWEDSSIVAFVFAMALQKMVYTLCILVSIPTRESRLEDLFNVALIQCKWWNIQECLRYDCKYLEY